MEIVKYGIYVQKYYYIAIDDREIDFIIIFIRAQVAAIQKSPSEQIDLYISTFYLQSTHTFC